MCGVCINSGIHQHLQSQRIQQFPQCLAILGLVRWLPLLILKLPFKLWGFFLCPRAGKSVCWSLNYILYNRSPCWDGVPAVTGSPFLLPLFMWFFYPSVCRSCFLRLQFFLRRNCSVCRYTFGKYVKVISVSFHTSNLDLPFLFLFYLFFIE